MGKSISRRAFIKGAAISAATITVLPRHILGGCGYVPPSDRLNIAGVGVGGMGSSNLHNMRRENIVALCDVDDDYASETFQRYSKAQRYVDYRVMLEQQPDIEAVLIATPDHTHAVIAKACMEMGKHVYVQKPLVATVYESRVLDRVARETGVVTQMGNQGHSSDNARDINEWIADGAIGDVSEVYVWTNRPHVYWTQGIERPSETPPVPHTLNWDLFLGPAPVRPYHPIYTPMSWRGWVDFGTGALGDMGAHLIDHAFWALELGLPSSFETRYTPYNGDSYPEATITYYEFPARGEKPPVKLTWYDGGLMPPRPDELDPEEELDPGGGVLYVGDKGKIIHGTYGSNPHLIPKSKMAAYSRPPKTLPRIEVSHEVNWIQACKGEGEASCPISYAARLTETMLLGLVSLKAGGMKLYYDGEKMEITNDTDANYFLHREYREGWSLD